MATKTLEPVRFLEQLKRDIQTVADLVPLRIGVRHDVMRLYPDTPPNVVGTALLIHVCSPSYLRQCTAGAPRHALDGTHDGEVNETHAAAAVERLDKLHKRKERKAADKAKRQDKKQEQAKTAEEMKQPPRPVPPGTRPVLSIKRRAAQ